MDISLKVLEILRAGTSDEEVKKSRQICQQLIEEAGHSAVMMNTKECVVHELERGKSESCLSCSSYLPCSKMITLMLIIAASLLLEKNLNEVCRMVNQVLFAKTKEEIMAPFDELSKEFS